MIRYIVKDGEKPVSVWATIGEARSSVIEYEYRTGRKAVIATERVR